MINHQIGNMTDNLQPSQFSIKEKKARLEPSLDEYPGPDSNRHVLTDNGF